MSKHKSHYEDATITPYGVRMNGLTGEHRYAWEKEILEKLKFKNIDHLKEEFGKTLGLDKEDPEYDTKLENAIVWKTFDKAFKDTFGHRGDYDELSRLSDEDAVTFWNAYQDSKNKGIWGNDKGLLVNPYTIEKGSTGESDKLSPITDNANRSMEDLFSIGVGEVFKATNEGTFNYEEFVKEYGLLQYDKSKFDSDYIRKDPEYLFAVDKQAKELRAQFNEDNKNQTYLAYKQFDEIASSISPKYKWYKDTDKFSFTAGDIKDLMSYYYTIENLADTQEAQQFLIDFLQDKEAKAQTTSEKFYNGFKGMGAAAASTTVMLAGMLSAAAGNAWDSSDYVEGLNDWQNFWNKVINNNITQYGNDIMKYQTWDKSTIDVLKNRNLTGDGIAKTVQEERGDFGDMIFSPNYLPDMIMQHGFTVASGAVSGTVGLLTKATGYGTKEVVKWGAKRLKKNIDDIVLKKIDNVMDAVGGFAGAGLAGSGESAMSGIDASERVLQEGEKEIAADFNNWATPLIAEWEQVYSDAVTQKKQSTEYQREIQQTVNILRDLNKTDYEINQILNEVENKEFERQREEFIKSLRAEYEPTRLDRMRELQRRAIQAQNTAFTFTQALTGFLNAGFKATTLSPQVQKLKEKFSLTPFRGNPYIAKDGTQKTLTKTEELLYKIYNALEEPFGEATEEYFTEVGTSVASGWHGSAFSNYMENEVGVVGEEAINNHFGASLKGAWEEALKAMVFKEAWYAAISAAASTSVSTGNISGIFRIADVIKDKENATLGDYLSATGEILLRSGVRQGWANATRKLQYYKEEAEIINNTINDIQNRGFYNDVVRLTNFYMQKEANLDDELNYRNSELGQAVAEINALERIKQTNPTFYNATQENLNRMENLEPDSQLAEQYIQEYRAANPLTQESEKEIVERIKDNAKKFKSLQEKVLEQKKRIGILYGKTLDQEVQNALVYGEIAYADSEERKKKMQDEVLESFNAGKTSTTELSKNPSIAEEDRKTYIEHGTLSNALNSVKKKIANLQKRKEELSNKKRLSISDKKELKKLSENINKAQSEQANLEERMSVISKNTLLSEQDIMNLAFSDRAKVLSDRFYKSTSDEQRKVIDNLKTILANGDSANNATSSITKINDIARLERAQKLHQDIRKASSKDLTEYYKTMKFNAANSQSKERVRDLGKIEDYESFRKTASVLFNHSRTGHLDRAHAKTILNKNENYKKYLEQSGKIKTLLEKLKQARKKKNFSKKQLMNQEFMTMFLNENGLTFDDTEKIDSILTSEALLEFYNKIVEHPDPTMSFSSDEIKEFKDLLIEMKKEVAENKDLRTPVSTTPTNPQTPQSDESGKNSEGTSVQGTLADQINKQLGDKKEEDKGSEKSKGNTEGQAVPNRVIEPVVMKGRPADIAKYIVSQISKMGIDVRKYPVLYNGIIYSMSIKDPAEAKKLLAVIASRVNSQNFSTTNVEEAKTLFNGTITDEEITMYDLTLSNNSTICYRDHNGKLTIGGIDVSNLEKELLAIIDRDYKTTPNLANQGQPTPVAQETSNTTIKISPLDIQDEVLRKASEAHGIEKFVRDYSTNEKEQVYFTIATDIESVNESNIILYMIVKHPKGTLEIDGEKYQVVGILNDANASPTISKLFGTAASQYSDTMQILKKKVSEDSVAISDEKLMYSGIYIYSTSPTHKQKDEEQLDVQEAVSENGRSFTIQDILKRIVKGKKSSESTDTDVIMYYTSPYDGREVTERVPKKKSVTKLTYLAFIDKNGKNISSASHGESQIELFIHEMSDVLLKNGQNFIDFIKNNANVAKLFEANETNYWISEYANDLLKGAKIISDTLVANTNPKSADARQPFILRGKRIYTNKHIDNIKSTAAQLNKSLSHKLNTNSYSLSLQVEEDGNNGLNIYLTHKIEPDSFDKSDVLNGVGRIMLGNVGADEIFKPTEVTKEHIFNYIKSLALLEDGSVRQDSDGYPFLKYQVDYDNIASVKDKYHKREQGIPLTPEEEAAITNAESLIKEGVLYASKSSLRRENLTLSTYPPLNYYKDQEGLPQPVKREPDNPLTPTPIPEKPKSRILTILENLRFTRNAEGRSGVEGISVTERAYKRSSVPVSPIVQLMGNTYDSIIRRVLADGNVTAVELQSQYPNINLEEAKNILTQILAWKYSMEDLGYKFFTDEVMLKGKLPNEQGELEDVKGVPDIIMYNDQTGEICIYDTKTTSVHDSMSMQDKKVGWSKQLSDYANLFEQTTGLKVSIVGVLPLYITYNKGAQVIDGKAMDGAAYAQVSSKFENGVVIKLNYEKFDLNANTPQPTTPSDTSLTTEAPNAPQVTPDTPPAGSEGVTPKKTPMPGAKFSGKRVNRDALKDASLKTQAKHCNIKL